MFSFCLPDLIISYNSVIFIYCEIKATNSVPHIYLRVTLLNLIYF